MGRVAVVIPTLNRSTRLAVAMAGVQAQTHGDLEIVVVDDGSTDDTPALLDRLAATDARIVVVPGPGAGGAAAARNVGLAAATAETVAFCDDDDRWHPAKVERQLAALNEWPQATAVSCHHAIATAGGRTLLHRGPVDPTSEELLWCSFAGGTCFAMVARDRCSVEVRFDETLPTCEDWDLYVRCSHDGPVVVVPEVLATVSLHDGGDRLTEQREARVAGHARFLALHREEMTDDCVAYHEVRGRIRGATSTAARLRLLPAVVRDSPPVVRRALRAESMAGRTGRLLHDPARSMRRLHKVLRERP